MTFHAVDLNPTRWPLSRVLTLLLAGAFAGLTMDIRVEHVAVVHEHRVAWTPIVYCALMTLATLLTCLVWSPRARTIMIPLYLLAFVVGGTGFYLHNDGHIVTALTGTLSAWTDSTLNHAEGPPQLAPLSLAGLGLLGILACLRRYDA